MKTKPRSIIIWEGEDRITITKGFAFEPQDNKPFCSKTKIKHRGLLQRWQRAQNIDNNYIEQPKSLCADGKVIPGWNAIRVNIDYNSEIPFVMDTQQRLITEIKNLRNQLGMAKRLYYQERTRNMDATQKDRFVARMKKVFKDVGDAKNSIYTGMDNYGGFYGGRLGGIE